VPQGQGIPVDMGGMEEKEEESSDMKREAV
jgi:hypothetical protein